MRSLIMYAASFWLSFCLSLAILSAPVPLPKKPVPPVFPVGSWKMAWGGTVYDVDFEKPDQLAQRHGLTRYLGNYNWDSKRRVLSISEHIDVETHWKHWRVRLDTSLKGETEGDYVGVPVQFIKPKE